MGAELQALVDNTFLEVARWRRNLFLVPTGKAGEAFIEELTSLINHFVTGSVFEPIALTLVSIFFPLLLQKPSKNSKAKDHVKYLSDRLTLWKEGRVEELLEEGRAIQKRLPTRMNESRHERAQKRFVSLMEKGKGC